MININYFGLIRAFVNGFLESNWFSWNKCWKKCKATSPTICKKNPLSKRGIDPEFSIANQLLLTFEYLRQYPTFLSLGFSYGISESYCHKLFHKMRAILAEVMGLKNSEALEYRDVKTVIAEVTVQPVE